MNRVLLVVIAVSVATSSALAQLYERIDMAGSVREHGAHFELRIRCVPWLKTFH